jgi:hypothetical protein
MGRALIHSVKLGLGDKFTDDMKDAWVSAFVLLFESNDVVMMMTMMMNICSSHFHPHTLSLINILPNLCPPPVVINSLQVEVYGALSYDMIRAQKMGKR